MTAKQNYTPTQVAEMTEAYQAATSQADRDAVLDTFAEKYGKTVSSVRGKLASLGVYKAKAKPAAKSNRVKKDELVARIADEAGMSDGFFESLTNANKSVLLWIIRLQNQVSDLEDEIFESTDELEA